MGDRDGCSARPAGDVDDRWTLRAADHALLGKRHLCEHLARVDKQATSASSRFLAACRAFNRGEFTEARLVETTARLGFKGMRGIFCSRVRQAVNGEGGKRIG